MDRRVPPANAVLVRAVAETVVVAKDEAVAATTATLAAPAANATLGTFSHPANVTSKQPVVLAKKSTVLLRPLPANA